MKPLCCLFAGNCEEGFELFACFAVALNLPLYVTNRGLKEAFDLYFKPFCCTHVPEEEFARTLSSSYCSCITNLLPKEAKNFFAFTKGFTSLCLLSPFFSYLNPSYFLEKEPLLVPSGLFFEKGQKTLKATPLIPIGTPTYTYFNTHREKLGFILKKSLPKLLSTTRVLVHFFSSKTPKEHLLSILQQLPESHSCLLKVDRSAVSLEDQAFLASLNLPRVHLVDSIPFFLPFLAVADALLLNADETALFALYVQKPTFFFESQDPIVPYLSQMGAVLSPHKKVDFFAWVDNYFAFDAHDRKEVLSKLQRRTFGLSPEYALVKKQIEAALKELTDRNLLS